MDKILQSMSQRNASITVTNDGATILKSIYVDNPAAKILIDISKCQDDEVGDGTTTVAVMAGELLKEAEKLVHAKIHPQIIIAGWRKARDVARKVLTEIARDNSTNEEDFKKDLLKKLPHKIDIGAIFNAMPSMHHSVKNLAPEQKELVFDIDMTDYDDVRNCCSGMYYVS